MFSHYFKVTLRSIRRQKSFAFINILGLAVGIACCVMSMLWVQDEMSFDRFHLNWRQIFRINCLKDTEQGRSLGSRTPGALAAELRTEFPDVRTAARFLLDSDYALVHEETSIIAERVGIVDPEFFEIFTFPLLKGRPETVLAEENQIVLTQTLASRLFGDQDPLGEVVTLMGEDPYIVSGVMADVPHNSHLQFQALIPFIKSGRFSIETDWKRPLPFTYVQLYEGMNSRLFEEKISGLIKSKVPDSRRTLSVQPLSRIYFFSQDIRDTSIHGEIKYVYIFSSMALLMLVIAAINFMNLATARSTRRSQEVGMRKVVGARRKDIIRQFLGESVIFAFLGLILALLLVWLSLPWFNQLAKKELRFDFSHGASFLLGLILVAVLTGFLAGSYPAFYLSRFEPVRVLKPRLGFPAGKAVLRKILVIAQFSLAVGFLVSAALVNRQLHFLRSADLGFDQERVIALASSEGFRQNPEVFLDRLGRFPGIENISYGSMLGFRNQMGGRIDIEWPGKDASDQTEIFTLGVGFNYLETMKIEIIEGRSFSADYSTDAEEAFIINQTAAHIMGMESPLGKKLSLGNRSGRIIGLAKDFHFASLRFPIAPLVLHIAPPAWHRIMVRAQPGALSDVLAHCQSVWESLDHVYPFSFGFIEDRFDYVYQGEKRIRSMFNTFTLIAVFISCLGLFGMAAYIAEQRTKEIGIRKVLGASTGELLVMFTREFAQWVVLANVFAWPLAYFLMKRWLQNFAYRVRFGFALFLLAGGAALMIAVLTVGFQAYRGARAHPVDSLKYE